MQSLQPQSSIVIKQFCFDESIAESLISKTSWYVAATIQKKALFSLTLYLPNTETS